MKYLPLLPALVHLYIFALESLRWGQPRTNAVFGLKPGDVEATRALAFNQGVYNLLLALAVLAGWSLWMGFFPWDRGPFAGQVLAAYGLGSMAAAGITLLVSSPRRWRPALIQALPAALGLGVLFLP